MMTRKHKYLLLLVIGVATTLFFIAFPKKAAPDYIGTYLFWDKCCPEINGFYRLSILKQDGTAVSGEIEEKYPNAAPTEKFIYPVKGSLEGSKLTLATSTIALEKETFSYQLQADFSQSPPFPSDALILNGTLTITRNGSEESQSPVSLKYGEAATTGSAAPAAENPAEPASATSDAAADNTGYVHAYKNHEPCCREVSDLGSILIQSVDQQGNVEGHVIDETGMEERAYPFKGSLKDGHLMFKSGLAANDPSNGYFAFDGHFTRTPPFDGILGMPPTIVLEGKIQIYSAAKNEEPNFQDSQLSSSGRVKFFPYSMDD